MRARFAAVLVCLALVGSGIATAQTQTQKTTTDAGGCELAASHIKQAKATIAAAWSERNWRRGPKKAQARAVAEHIACLPRLSDRRELQHERAQARAKLRLYRLYRSVAPFRCHSGLRGFYAIPCYIIACESHFNWWARNPSGASWLYQLLGWGAPAPVNWRAKVANHVIAHRVSSGSRNFSPWVCA